MIDVTRQVFPKSIATNCREGDSHEVAIGNLSIAGNSGSFRARSFLADVPDRPKLRATVAEQPYIGRSFPSTPISLSFPIPFSHPGVHCSEVKSTSPSLLSLFPFVQSNVAIVKSILPYQGRTQEGFKDGFKSFISSSVRESSSVAFE